MENKNAWSYAAPIKPRSINAEQAAAQAAEMDAIAARMAAAEKARELECKKAAEMAAKKQAEQAKARRAALKAERDKATAERAARRALVDGKTRDRAQSAAFDALKSAWMSDPADGEKLETLAKAIAGIVARKCADPARKSALYSDKVSDGGQSSAILDLYRAIYADMALLANTRAAAAEERTIMRVTQGGDIKRTYIESDRLNAIIGKTLGDGADVVQSVILELLEQLDKHGGADNWLEQSCSVERLAKQVLIRRDDSAAYRTVETTPIQEAFRAARREVSDNSAVKESSAKYAYIDALECGDEDERGEGRVYRRLALYSDIGGAPCNGRIDSAAGSPRGYSDSADNYTVGTSDYRRYYALRDRLNLTERQEQILVLREKGYGYRAIGTYIGIREETVYTTMRRLREQLDGMDFAPKKVNKGKKQ